MLFYLFFFQALRYLWREQVLRGYVGNNGREATGERGRWNTQTGKGE